MLRVTSPRRRNSRARARNNRWRRGVFCTLGTGDVDFGAFFAELESVGYSGWLVVEQDWVPGPDDDVAKQIAAQAANRRWLEEHVGV